METFLAAFVLMLLAAAGMGVGWLVRGRELKGTCATLGAMSDEPCAICGNDPARCEGDTPGR